MKRARMRIGVVSDTHGHVPFTTAALERLELEKVDLVLHCGDIGSPSVVPLFSAWPTHFVFGNVDHDIFELREAIRKAGQSCHERFGELEVGGVKIAFLHSDDEALFDETISSGKWGLVCYGHTHVANQHRVGETLVLNPGALYRANPRSFATVELPSLKVTHIPVGATP